jgi:hypothetical protein
VTINKFSSAVTVNLDLKLKANPNLVLVNPTYVLATDLRRATRRKHGGRLRTQHRRPQRNANRLGGGPRGYEQGSIDDARDGFSDLYPTATLRWNNGAHNWMVYGAGDIPVGTYDASRLANLGIGHGAADAGAGYTYFDPKTGHEFCWLLG